MTRPAPAAPARPSPRPRAQPLSLTKLRGLSPATRRALKARGITTCPQLLRAAGLAEARAALAREAGLGPGALLALVRRADMARVDGLGLMFQLMVEELGVADLPALAACGPVELHARLDEGEEARAEAHRRARAIEALGERGEDAAEIGEADALVDEEALDLVEHRRVGEIVVAAEDAASADHGERRGVRAHLPHLHVARVGAEKDARALFRGEPEAVLHVRRRVVGRKV